MKKIFVTLTLTLFLLISYAQSKSNTLPDMYHFVSVKSYVGTIQVVSTGLILNRFRDGLWVALTKNGIKLTETNYSRGFRMGDYTEYSPVTRQIVVEGNYLNGLRSGNWIYYNEYTGLVLRVLVYSKGLIIDSF